MCIDGLVLIVIIRVSLLCSLAWAGCSGANGSTSSPHFNGAAIRTALAWRLV